MKRKGVKVVEAKLGRMKAWGLCWRGRNLIEIDPRQKAYRYLNTLVHELLHHTCPSRGESWVRRSAGTISKAVWEAGYRKVSK